MRNSVDFKSISQPNSRKSTPKTSKRDFTVFFDVKKRKKEWRIDVFQAFKANLLELGWEIDHVRLKVLYVVFRELSKYIKWLRILIFFIFRHYFPGKALSTEKLMKNDKIKMRNHLYIWKALEKRYSGLLSKHGWFLNLTWVI